MLEPLTPSRPSNDWYWSGEVSWQNKFISLKQFPTRFSLYNAKKLPKTPSFHFFSQYVCGHIGIYIFIFLTFPTVSNTASNIGDCFTQLKWHLYLGPNSKVAVFNIHKRVCGYKAFWNHNKHREAWGICSTSRYATSKDSQQLLTILTLFFPQVKRLSQPH